MGADLLLARLAAKKDKAAHLDWAAGREAVNALPTHQLTYAYDGAFGDPPDDPQEAREDIYRVFDELQSAVTDTRRDVDVWEVGDLVIWVTGGLSWGDDPTEAFDVFNKAGYFPEVLAAIGFETEALA